MNETNDKSTNPIFTAWAERSVSSTNQIPGFHNTPSRIKSIFGGPSLPKTSGHWTTQEADPQGAPLDPPPVVLSNPAPFYASIRANDLILSYPSEADADKAIHAFLTTMTPVFGDALMPTREDLLSIGFIGPRAATISVLDLFKALESTGSVNTTKPVRIYSSHTLYQHFRNAGHAYDKPASGSVPTTFIENDPLTMTPYEGGEPAEIGDITEVEVVEEGGVLTRRKKKGKGNLTQKGNKSHRALLLDKARNYLPRIPNAAEKFTNTHKHYAAVSKAISRISSVSGLDGGLLRSYMSAQAAGESSYNPTATNKSSKAFGLWQILPSNAKKHLGREFNYSASDGDINAQIKVAQTMLERAAAYISANFTISPEGVITPKVKAGKLQAIAQYRVDLPNNTNPLIAKLWLLGVMWGAGSPVDANLANIKKFAKSRIAKIYTAAALLH